MAGQSASFDYTSFKKNHEHGGEKLSDEIAVMIESLKSFPDNQSKCCIYKVPDHIRQSNESEAYTPQVISIGPFHHNNPKLQKMESFKLRYLMSFGKRVQTKLEEMVRTIKIAEERVRECYSDRETLPLDSDDFVKMILVDASFIIEYFWKNKSKVNWTEYDKEILKPWLCNRMQMDLILLENQLPFFIIKEIYDTAFPSHLERDHPFIELCFCQFQYYNVQNFTHSGNSEEILHFTDLLRNFSLPRRERQPKRNSEIIKEMRSTTQLARAGLKFTVSKSNNCSPLELKYANGDLEIPRFQLDKNTEIYVRNLIAFEQSHYPEDQAYITEYYFLLSLLIRGPKDVIFLVRKGVFNWVDQGIDPASVLNKILETIDCSLKTDDYSNLAEELNKFYKTSLRFYLKIMMDILKHDYFRNPWRGTATIGGILLVLLTVIQTVCALISVKNWK